MKVQSLTKIALMSTIICILAPISIPIPVSPVALTLATFALYLTAYILKPAQALAATGIYLLLGAVGIPVFSGYMSGISRFAAAGGGYLVGYLFLVGISSLAIHRFPTKPAFQIMGMFLGTMTTYTMGTLWMAHVINAGFWETLPMGALIYIPLDLVKIGLSCYIGRNVQKYVYRA